MKLMLKNKRLAFPALAKPQAIGDGEPAYGARLIIDPDDKANLARPSRAPLADWAEFHGL